MQQKVSDSLGKLLTDGFSNLHVSAGIWKQINLIVTGSALDFHPIFFSFLFLKQTAQNNPIH